MMGKIKFASNATLAGYSLIIQMLRAHYITETIDRANTTILQHFVLILTNADFLLNKTWNAFFIDLFDLSSALVLNPHLPKRGW